MKYAIMLLMLLITKPIATTTEISFMILHEVNLKPIEIIYRYDISNLESQFTKRKDMKKYYNDIFYYVSKKTNLSPEFIYSYFIWEASNSELWLEHNNPGGIKGKGVKYMDDCGSFKCNFKSFKTLEEGVDHWITVFNNDRYKRCKDLKIKECFKCFQEQGYHTAKNWHKRWLTSKQF